MIRVWIGIVCTVGLVMGAMTLGLSELECAECGGLCEVENDCNIGCQCPNFGPHNGTCIPMD